MAERNDHQRWYIELPLPGLRHANSSHFFRHLCNQYVSMRWDKTAFLPLPLDKLKFLLKARFFQKQCLGIQWSQDLMRSLQKGSLHPHGQGHCLGAPILGYIQPALIFRPWWNFHAVQIGSLSEPMPWPWPHLNLVYIYNGQLKLSLSGYNPC